MSIGSSGGRLLRASEKDIWVDRLIEQAFRVAARWWPLALIVVSMLLFLPGLDIRPFRGEEGRRALQALAMLEHGAWWRLEVLDLHYVNKPPLLPWAIAGLAALSGKLDEFAVRLPIVLSAMAGALTAGALATRMVDSERRHLAGLLAGLVFLLSGYMQMKARVAETDVPSIALVGAGFMAWALGRLSDARLPAWWTLSAVFLALAALARGPIPLMFVAVPMLATEFLDKQRGRPMAVVLVLAAAMLPCLAWAASNLGSEGDKVERWALEMRLVTDQSVAEHLRTLLLLGRIPHALILLLPWLVFALAWALYRAADAQPGQGWLVRALLLYVGPLSLLVLLWPASRERYAMPIVWPIAVLAGVAMTNLWNDRRFVARTAAAALVAALAFQYLVAFGFDGKNDYQRAIRRAAGTLQRLVANSGPGEFLVVVYDEPDHDLLGYLPRTVPRVAPANIGSAARYLAANKDVVAELLATGRWRIVAGPDGTDTTFLERKP